MRCSDPWLAITTFVSRRDTQLPPYPDQLSQMDGNVSTISQLAVSVYPAPWAESATEDCNPEALLLHPLKWRFFSKWWYLHWLDPMHCSISKILVFLQGLLAVSSLHPHYRCMWQPSWHTTAPWMACLCGVSGAYHGLYRVEMFLFTKIP